MYFYTQICSEWSYAFPTHRAAKEVTCVLPASRGPRAWWHLALAEAFIRLRFCRGVCWTSRGSDITLCHRLSPAVEEGLERGEGQRSRSRAPSASPVASRCAQCTEPMDGLHGPVRASPACASAVVPQGLCRLVVCLPRTLPAHLQIAAACSELPLASTVALTPSPLSLPACLSPRASAQRRVHAVTCPWCALEWLLFCFVKGGN